MVLQLRKDLEQSFSAVYFDNFFNSPKLTEKLFQKGIYSIGTAHWIELWQSKWQKWSTISRSKGELVSSFFLGNTMACKWMDNRPVLLSSSDLPLKEWMTYYQFRGKKRVQIQSIRFVVIRLSSFTIAICVDHGLILWSTIMLLIFWIESHLLDFASAFFLIWWILNVPIVISLMTWNILPNCVSLITRLVSQKTWFNTIKTGRGQYQSWKRLRGTTNLNQLIIITRLPNDGKAMCMLRNGG